MHSSIYEGQTTHSQPPLSPLIRFNPQINMLVILFYAQSEAVYPLNEMKWIKRNRTRTLTFNLHVIFTFLFFTVTKAQQGSSNVRVLVRFVCIFSPQVSFYVYLRCSHRWIAKPQVQTYVCRAQWGVLKARSLCWVGREGRRLDACTARGHKHPGSSAVQTSVCLSTVAIQSELIAVLF